MSKNNFFTIIDYGSSTIRLGVFSDDLRNLYTSAKDFITKNDYEEQYSYLNILIKEAEKKISKHLDSAIILYDTPDIYTIDISLRKDFDQEISIKEIYSSIILESNQLINNNYIDKKIIHLITTKNIIDGEEINENFDKNLKAKSIIVEVKFICLRLDEYENILKVFKENNLQILNVYCSSYIKSLSYINSVNENKLVSFLDIGFERSTLLLFNNKKLINMKSIPVGGNHITKDISNVLKLNIEDSEKIKKAFNKSENEFSYDQDINESNSNIQEILGKSVSIDLLKKVVLSRVEEIFELIFKDINLFNYSQEKSNIHIVLIGKGSKLFDKNSFHLNDKFSFKEIIYYDEDDVEICKSGLVFEKNLRKDRAIIATKSIKKYGIFERFFNFFDR